MSDNNSHDPKSPTHDGSLNSPDETTKTKTKNNSNNNSNSNSLGKGTEFRARKSLMDREMLEASPSQFLGFLNLFLLALLFYIGATVVHHYRQGTLLRSVRLLEVMFTDFYGLAMADCCLMLFVFTAFFLQKIFLWNIFPNIVIRTLHHLLHCILFGLAAGFAFYRDWPWPQSGSLMVHSLVLYMKMHSYLSTNFELAKEWKANGKKPSTNPSDYPNNVTLFNFIDFLLVPTLVYEPMYPRTKEIRMTYLIEKGSLFLGGFVLLYLTISTYIIPVLEDLMNLSLVESVMILSMPFLLGYLLIFFLIFECICNFMAEVTRFADREFYSDWWNSTNFDEFSRKWNKPVHEFLLRHVYLESLKTYKISKRNATFATFLFSLILHELALTVAGRSFRPYITVTAMVQLPLITILRHPIFRGTRLGNMFFWFGMILGVPLLCVLYAREHYGLEPPSIIFIMGFLGFLVGVVILLVLLQWLFFPKSKYEKQN